jgi:spore germination protein YaaH
LPQSKINDDIKNANGLYTVEQLVVTGTNVVNDLANTPFSVNNIIITVNGVDLYAGTHFTVAGQAITFDPVVIGYDIETTDTLYAVYFRV